MRNDNDLLRAADASASDLATCAVWMVVAILGAMIGASFFGN